MMHILPLRNSDGFGWLMASIIFLECNQQAYEYMWNCESYTGLLFFCWTSSME